MSRFDVSKNRARVTFDDASGGLADLPLDQMKMNQFGALRNVLTKPPAFLQQRGPVTNVNGQASTGTVGSRLPGGWDVFKGDPKSASGAVNTYVFALQAYSGVNVPIGPAIATLPTSAATSFTDLGMVTDAYQTTGTVVDAVSGNGPGAQFSDRLVLPCSAVNANGTPQPGPPVQVRGFNAQYKTGTVTVTNGSTAVVGAGTTFTAAMVGRWFIVRDELTTTQHVYRVATFTDATHITLSSVYKGATGPTKPYSITEQAYCSGDQTVWSDGKPRAMAVLNVWNRLLLLGYSEVPSTAGLPDRYQPSGIRWSGIENSSEGALVGDGVGQGLDGWHANGKLILPGDGGTIMAGVKVGQAVVVLMQRAACVLYGQPAFDTPAGLDYSTTWDVGCSGPESYANTPYGLFFFDRTRGLMLWNGQGQPEPISDDHMRGILLPLMGASSSPTQVDCGVHMGYYRDHLVLCDTRTGASFLFHIPTRSWSQLTGRTVQSMFYMRRGRRRDAATALDQPLLCVTMTNSTTGDFFNPPGTYMSSGFAFGFLNAVSTIIDKPGLSPCDWPTQSSSYPDNTLSANLPIIVAARTSRNGSRIRRMRAKKWFLEGGIFGRYEHGVAGVSLNVQGGPDGARYGAFAGAVPVALQTDPGTSGSLAKYTGGGTTGFPAIGAQWTNDLYGVASNQQFLLRYVGTDATKRGMQMINTQQTNSYIRARLGINSLGSTGRWGLMVKCISAAHQGLLFMLDTTNGMEKPLLRLVALETGAFINGGPFVDAYMQLGGYQSLVSQGTVHPGGLWMSLQTYANMVIGHLYDADPALGGVPFASLAADLSYIGGYDAIYGSGISGNAGIYVEGNGLDVTFDDVWCGSMPLVGGSVLGWPDPSNGDLMDFPPTTSHGFVQSTREPMIGASLFTPYPSMKTKIDQLTLDCMLGSEGDMP